MIEKILEHIKNEKKKLSKEMCWYNSTLVIIVTLVFIVFGFLIWRHMERGHHTDKKNNKYP